jgi:hypothetical protein
MKRAVLMVWNVVLVEMVLIVRFVEIVKMVESVSSLRLLEVGRKRITIRTSGPLNRLAK